MLPCFGVQCREGCGTLCTARSPGNDRVDGLADAAITTVVSAARGLVTARTWHNTTMTRPGGRRDMTSRIAALRTSRRPNGNRRFAGVVIARTVPVPQQDRFPDAGRPSVSGARDYGPVTSEQAGSERGGSRPGHEASGEGVALGQSGDRDGARRLFAKV